MRRLVLEWSLKDMDPVLQQMEISKAENLKSRDDSRAALPQLADD